MREGSVVGAAEIPTRRPNQVVTATEPDLLLVAPRRLLRSTADTDRTDAFVAHSEAVMSKRPEILVVCTRNAGRSVAARVLLDHHGGGQVVVRSAGMRPGDTIDPVVAEVLTERGLDSSKEFPKALDDEIARSADIVVTMGCGDACPVYPGRRQLDWELADPAGKTVDEVRPIVDAIERHSLALLSDLGIQPASPP